MLDKHCGGTGRVGVKEGLVLSEDRLESARANTEAPAIYSTRKYLKPRRMPLRVAMLRTIVPYWFMKSVRVPAMETSKRRRARRKEKTGVMRSERVQTRRLGMSKGRETIGRVCRVVRQKEGEGGTSFVGGDCSASALTATLSSHLPLALSRHSR